jgi:hypothetical protein
MFWLANGMLLYFFIKHFVVDFLIQNRFPWMWLNKGKFGHGGGLVHSLTHVLSTLPLLGFLVVYLTPIIQDVNWLRLMWYSLAFEFVTHYLMDYSKVKICQRRGWKAHTSPYFWDMLGLDQLVHYATYWIIATIWLGVLVGV